MRVGCLETRSSPQWGRAGLFRVVVPPCVLRPLTDKLIDSFRFCNISPSAQALAHEHPNRNANVLQIRHNEPQVTLRHLLGLGTPASTCAGGFILLGPDKAGGL